MKVGEVNISKITKAITTSQRQSSYAVCWIKNEVIDVEIDNVFCEDLSNSIFFLKPNCHWKIIKNDNLSHAGYVLYLTREILNHPQLSKLHINQIRLFSQDEIPLFKLSPGIELRTQAILEMIDELIGSTLNHKNEAILSLLNTFFVYCDGQCNIKSVISNNNAKANVVYRYKKMVDKYISKFHDVADYAQLLNISPKYLNECVKAVLGVGAKHIIIEQLLMRSRHALKFSNKSIKEISFELGFSSPDYFSYFFKTHTTTTPSTLRKS